MNENLTERFGRSRDAFSRQDCQAAARPPPPQLNVKVRQYFEAASTQPEPGSWLLRPEIPSTDELVDFSNKASSNPNVPEIPRNLPKGEWESKETYLRTHYELLREDALGALRKVIHRVRERPTADEDAFDDVAVGIYEQVRICAVTCSTRGIATRVTFSVYRAKKKILWEQSKRLITGGIVVLTPRSDMFQRKALVATVAARPLAGLQQNPPEIDLFIARPDEQEIDPAIEWVMVEERASLYEADRHTLLALQRMMREPFPLEEHLVNAEPSVDVPIHVQERHVLDMSDVIPNITARNYNNVDVLNDWPEDPECELDDTQLAALRQILTKRLAIIQGPPGTGKTHVSVQALKIMLANHKTNDPPIIIACQTNHAIDQLLRHVADFEPEAFVRLGGRSKDLDKVKTRTLYEVRMLSSNNPVSGSLGRGARSAMKKLEPKIDVFLSPLDPNKQPLQVDLLVNFGFLTQAQAGSLVAGASEWVQDHVKDADAASSPFSRWLGQALRSVPYKPMEADYGFDYEEVDLEFEQLKELEAENVARDDEDFETLKGSTIPIADNFTAVSKTGSFISAAKVKEVLVNEQDMWEIPVKTRPAVYRYLHSELKEKLVSGFREMARSYNEHALRRRIGNWEQDEAILKSQKIIGMTTTGLSKYRGLIAALEPKIVIIEEAAETREAPVTVGCLPSLQQLILVGDHQQLRPHCHSRILEDKPYYLNVSLFERLVNNRVEFTQLSTQRRMIPEIRRLLHPIYGETIRDHDFVLDPNNRPDVPGMGGVNSFFFTHEWPEQRDDQMSAFNSKEADMIANFVEYLAYNNVKLANITILTFYNGQRKTILGRLRVKPSLPGQQFNVVTVDSYQGEENEIVLLSLVRSNTGGNIGFLNNINRVCVALSRAQRGFYMFGNGKLLYNHKERNDINSTKEHYGEHKEKTFWQKILSILGNTGENEADRLNIVPTCRVGSELAVYCGNHNNKTVITDPTDFHNIIGGCRHMCGANLECDHPCKLTCHALAHDLVKCHEPCKRVLACGHQCDQVCKDSCHCPICHRIYPKPESGDQNLNPAVEETAGRPAAGPWNTFANNQHARSTASAFIPPSGRQQTQTANALLDVSVEDLTTDIENVAVGPSRAGNISQKTPSSFSVKEQVVQRVNGKRTKRKEKFTLTNAEPSNPEENKDWSKEDSLLD